jgi:hypothetical protein
MMSRFCLMATQAVGVETLHDVAPMAVRALERSMHPAQGKSGLRVMEEGIFPELLTMAFTAIRQHTPVHIVLLVTLRASLRFSSKPSSVAMTLDAVEVEMHAIQSEIAVEISRHFPAPLAVATCTLFSEFTLVYVFVTSHALG